MKIKHFVYCLTFILVLLLNVSSAYCRELVFVLDTSAAMNEADPNHQAPDCFTWLAAALPENDKVSLITFNESANMVRPLVSLKDKPLYVDAPTYSGGSDPGSALLMSIQQFAAQNTIDRAIIIITSGNINLNNTNAINNSVDKFRTAIKQAQGLAIPIYSLNLRYQSANYQPNEIYQQPYIKDLPIQNWQLLSAMRTLAHDNFKIDLKSVQINNDSTSGTLSFNNPYENNADLRLIISSSLPGKAELKFANPTLTLQGRFIKVFDVTNLSSNTVEFAVDYPAGAALSVDLKPKFEVEDNKQVATSDNYIPWLMAALGIALILAFLFFLNRKNKYLEQSAEPEPKIIQSPAVTSTKTEVQRPIPIKEIKPPKVAVEEDVSDKPLTEKKIPYSGKVVIYITKAPNDEEFEPREFNLFRVFDAHELTLAEILATCDINLEFQGANKIIINPDKSGLSVKNDSDCTITKRRSLLGKGQQTVIYYDTALNILSADEEVELTFMYKSLKPSS